MGERKGQNLYYPPDYDPKVGGLNKFLGTHALRERARKLHMGILIIRFEMPYNIWCDGCKNHIGMGVRYNAEKTKIGMYYTTPVYQFRMKCHLCDNHFEIKTDPANLDYVIVSGARRQENRWDPTENGQIVPETKETQKRLFDDAMFRLEHKTGDASGATLAKPRLGKLVGRNEVVWKDDYEANCSLRRNFRKRRKELEDSALHDSLLLARSSLDIHLLPESEEDRNMASLLALRPSKSMEEKQTVARSTILNSPALPSSSGLITSFGGLKKEESLSKSRPLSRNTLGITIKNKKVPKTAVSSNCDAKIYEKDEVINDSKESEINIDDRSDVAECDKGIVDQIDGEISNSTPKCKEIINIEITGTRNSKGDIKNMNFGNDNKSINVDDKNVGNNKDVDKIDDNNDKIDDKDNKNHSEDKICNMNESKIRGISLVGDYSSSGESSE